MKKSTLFSIVLFAVFATLGIFCFDNGYIGILFLVASAIFATVALITALKNRSGGNKE